MSAQYRISIKFDNALSPSHLRAQFAGSNAHEKVFTPASALFCLPKLFKSQAERGIGCHVNSKQGETRVPGIHFPGEIIEDKASNHKTPQILLASQEWRYCDRSTPTSTAPFIVCAYKLFLPCFPQGFHLSNLAALLLYRWSLHFLEQDLPDS